jgi:hypothetical protein
MIVSIFPACFIHIQDTSKLKIHWLKVDLQRAGMICIMTMKCSNSQDASWSYRLWFGLDNVFSIMCIKIILKHLSNQITKL